MIWIAAAVVAVALSLLVWGWFEAGWLRKRVVEVEIQGLPEELDGARVAHLADLHLGALGRGKEAVEGAVAWVAARRPDLVCLTGDLVSRRSGLALLADLLRRLAPCVVVLGNHDLDDTRDPFSQRFDVELLERLEGVTVLGNESLELQLRGACVQVVGVDPSDYARRLARPHELAQPSAALRLLLCHFPGIVRRMPPGAFHLILSGHLHAGQIVIPFPGGGLRLAHPKAREVHGVYRLGSTALHVSPGLGTTFVPFRFLARPEVTELVLRSGRR